MVAPFLPDEEKVSAIRAALPATGAGIYLNAGTLGPLPGETARAMAEVAEYELTVGRGAPDYIADASERMAEARAAVAAILSSDVGTVALTHSTTDAMNIAVAGLDWRSGDRAVTTNAEHWGGYGPLVAVADRHGVELDIVDVGRGEDADAVVAAFDRAIGPRTRLVALSHVAWTTGAVLPVRAIAEIATARGVLVVVDGAQAVGAIPVDAAALGADAYAVPAQKWLLGPEGMGALWVAPGAVDRIRPTFAGWWSFDDPGHRPPYRRHGDARRLEAGAWHRPSVVGFARSCGWLAMFVGLGWAHDRGRRLARRTADALAALPGVELVTPRQSMAGLVTFRLPGWPAETVLDELERRAFVIARTITETDWVRLSVGFWNTESELDRATEVIALLARHTPDSIPARPALTILGEG